MLMDDATWRRHANPLSVYSRFTILPLLTLAIWSYDWIGGWCVPFIALALFWNWYNPRAFKAVDTISGWASEGVIGERIYLKRQENNVRLGHVRAIHILSTCTALAAIIWLWGLWTHDLPTTLWSLTLTMLFKTWAFDRMVWIYRESKENGISSTNTKQLHNR
ncbi:hypothetical protein SAMN06265368_4409 [Cohaesibacter gelatinilyticus]|uniref:Uncharacterized protein n=2 Tax=Cohaesibacter gelatinilyticus TaxID=372072 RepID=A0A285PHT3_9HYPH|nr:hypothetical protein SAMN06265368_4409 [Cohaesibacter gelatinilyticus]